MFSNSINIFIIESTINIFSGLNLSNSFSFKLKFNFGLIKINRSPLEKFLKFFLPTELLLSYDE